MSILGNNELWSSKLALVEGPNDERFLYALLSSLGVSEIQVMPCGGVSGFRPMVQAISSNQLKGGQDLQSILIVRDADDNPAGAAESIENIYRDFGYAIPSSPGVMTSSTPKTGFVIVPGDSASGTLDDVLLNSIHDEDQRILDCVEGYFTCLEADDHPLQVPPSKLKLDSFLSANGHAGRIGDAARAGAFNFSSVALGELRCVLGDM